MQPSSYIFANSILNWRFGGGRPGENYQNEVTSSISESDDDPDEQV